MAVNALGEVAIATTTTGVVIARCVDAKDDDDDDDDDSPLEATSCVARRGATTTIDAVAWSAPVTTTTRGGDGAFCALATRASDGGVETYARATTTTSRRERAFDVGEDWRARCARDAYARVDDDVVVDDATSGGRAATRCADALEWLDEEDDEAAAAVTDAGETRVKEEHPSSSLADARALPPNAVSKYDDDTLAPYGALARGTMIEVASSADASASWRVAKVTSTASNVAIRARVAFVHGDGDGDDVTSESTYVVWMPESTAATTSGGNGAPRSVRSPPTIPCQTRVAARGGGAGTSGQRVECRVRPTAPTTGAFAATSDAVNVGDVVEVLYKRAWRAGRVASKSDDDGGARECECVVKLTADGNRETRVALRECRLRATWGGVDRGWCRATDDDAVTLPSALSDDDCDEDMRDAMGDAPGKRRAVDDVRAEGIVAVDALESMFPSSKKNTKTSAKTSVNAAAVAADARKKPARGKRSRRGADTIDIERRNQHFDDAPFKRDDLLSFTSCAWACARSGTSDVHILTCGARSGHVVSYVMRDNDCSMTLLHVMRVSLSAHVTSVRWQVGEQDASLFVGASDGSILRATSSSARVFECAKAVLNVDGGAKVTSATATTTVSCGVGDIFETIARVADADGAPVTCMDAADDDARGVALVAGKANGDVFMATFAPSRAPASWIKRISVHAIHSACLTRAGTRDEPVVCAYVVCALAYAALDVPRHPRDADASIRAFARTTQRATTSFATATACSVGAAVSPSRTVVARCDAFTPLHKLPNLEGFKEAKFWRGALCTQSFIA